MKRLLIGMMTGLFILGACSSQTEDDVEESETEDEVVDMAETTENEETEEDEEEVDDESVEVEKGLFDVEVTIPASLIEGQDVDEIIESVKTEGIEEVDVNDDGSLTYYMSKSTHKDLLSDLGNSIEEYMDEIIADDEFASIKDLEANKSYTQFTMIVDQEDYETSFDGFAALGVAIPGLYYQLFDGVSSDEFEVKVELKDEESGDVFDTIIYPDALEEMEEIED